jgi:hypothetical protein
LAVQGERDIDGDRNLSQTIRQEIYGEVFERNLGQDTPLGLDRGLNALWTEGGLMYAPPLR